MQEAQYRAHGLWDELKTAAQVMDDVDKTGDAEAIRSIDELRELLAITSGFEDGERVLVTETLLTQIQQTWAQISGYLQNYLSSLQSVHLSQAAAQAEALRSLLVLMPRALAQGPAQASWTKTFNSFRVDLEQSRDRLIQRLDATLAEADERELRLRAEVEELTLKLATASSSADALEGRIVQGEARLDYALTSTNEAFIAGQSARESDFKSWLTGQEMVFEKLASPHLVSLKQAEADAQTHLSSVSKLRTSTVEMSHLAAGDVLADQYGEYAKSARRASYVAYIIGVVAAVGSIAIILAAFGAIYSELTWQSVTLKVTLTAAAGGLAAVAFRFGGQAVRRATSFKRQELELRALRPFLEDVKGADLAKTAFLERAFGHAWEDPAASKGEADVNESLVKLVASLVQNLPKSNA